MIQYPPIIADTVPAFVMGELVNEKWEKQIYNDKFELSEGFHTSFKLKSDSKLEDKTNKVLKIEGMYEGPSEPNNYAYVQIEEENYELSDYICPNNGKGTYFRDQLYGYITKNDKKEYYIELFTIGYSQGSIKLNFSPNPAVNKLQVTTSLILIKELETSNLIAKFINPIKNNEYENGQIEFKIFVFPVEFLDYNEGFIVFSSKQSITSGYNYKFQLAFADQENIDNNFYAYSSTAVGKCIGVGKTDKPVIGINNYKNGSLISNYQNSFQGVYKTSSVTSETLYSYSFDLMNGQDNLIESSGEILYTQKIQNKIDNSWITPEFRIKKDLIPNAVYKLRFSITTINGYKDSIVYNLIAVTEIPNSFSGDITFSTTQESGGVHLSLSGEVPAGNYLLERCEKENGEWEEISRFNIGVSREYPELFWEDYTIKNGIEYIYGIRQYVTQNELTYYSSRVSGSITPYFEHMYLSDNERQLCIKFNPKVSSFKNSIQETKTDVLDSKYPVFFRNSLLKYKEIPISGLISYHMDINNLFNPQEKLNSINLSNDNFYAEHQFKLEVMDWLNNGKPKLFRSPAEGNYVVRVMNVSLSPDDKLSRMLHTFSATGYECAAADFNTLKEFEVCLLKQGKINTEYRTHSIILDEVEDFSDSGTIYNIKWSTNYPYVFPQNTGLKLDKEYYSNIKGEFQTEEERYETIKFIKPSGETHVVSYGTLYYDKLIEENETPTEAISYSLEDMINGEDKIISIDTNEETTIDDLLKPYSVTVQKIMGMNQGECWIIINNTTINLADGLFRIYEDLPVNTTITASAGVHLIINGRFKKGVN